MADTNGCCICGAKVAREVGDVAEVGVKDGFIVYGRHGQRRKFCNRHANHPTAHERVVVHLPEHPE